MKYGLSDQVIAKLKEVFKNFSLVKEVILYGSRAKGTYKKGSDIDLVIKGANIDIAYLGKIRNALDDLPLPYIIDLCVFDNIDNTSLLDHIKRVGIVFYP